MPRPKKYPHAIYIRLSDEGLAGLEKTATTMGLKTAEAGRLIIEHSVKGEPIKLNKEGSHGSVQQKKSK